MLVPRFLRLDNMEPTPLTDQEIRPYVVQAMEWYSKDRQDEYGDDLLALPELIEYTLAEHYLVVINEEYLLAYSISGEWFSRTPSLTEEYIFRLKKGKTPLAQVMTVLRVMGKLHRARDVYVCPDKPALKRLYAKHGAVDSVTFMRIT